MVSVFRYWNQYFGPGVGVSVLISTFWSWYQFFSADINGLVTISVLELVFWS